MFDFGNLFNGLISGISNIFATDATNQAQIKIAQETNAMNYKIASERNAMEIKESEKAYQRSTAANQIKELVKTGLSLQQARQIVSGSGSPATYTPAQLDTAQLQAPTIQAPDLSGFGTAAGSVGSLIDNAIKDPDGGALGYTAAHGAMQDVSNIIDLFPEDSLISWKDFKSFVDSSENEKIKSFRDSSSFKRIKSNLFGQKAFMNYARNAFDNSCSKQRLAAARLEVQQKQIAIRIERLREKVDESNMLLITSKNQFELHQLPILYTRDMIDALDEIAVLLPQYQYHNTEDYQKVAFEVLKQHNINELWLEQIEGIKKNAANSGLAAFTEQDTFLLNYATALQTLGLSPQQIVAAASVKIAQEVAPKLKTGVEGVIDRWKQTRENKKHVGSSAGRKF